MSTLKTNNIEHLDASSPSIQLDVGGGMVVAGVITATSMDLSGSDGFTVGTGASVSSPATNVLALGTNDTERLRITSHGRVGIGTDSITGQVQIDTASANRGLTLNAPGNGTYITFESNNTAFADVGSEAGVLGSGTNDLLVLNARDARDLAFRTNSSERLRITSDGKIGINSTSPSAETMDIVGTAPKINIDSTNGSSGFRLNIIQSSSQLFRVQNAGTTAFEVNSNGNTLLANGNLVFSTSGTGIDFSATGDGSGTATSELLDDYEEGYHTCTASNSVTLNTSINQISYTKIGRQVTVGGQIQVSNSNSGSALVLSLPYACKDNSEGDALYTGAVRLYAADIAADAKWVIVQTEPGSATAAFLDVRDNTSTNPHACTSSGYYMFTLTYPTA